MNVIKRMWTAAAPAWRCMWLSALLLAAGCAGVPAGSGQAGTPKNIIIMFADGTAPTQLEFGRYTARHLRNEGFAVTDIMLREGTLGLLSTHPANAFVTDSAAGASAMSTGRKVNNFVISMTPDGQRPVTLMQAAKARGKRIGLVTTATVYDASPAAFSVNARDRGDSQAIVDQYAQGAPEILRRDFYNSLLAAFTEDEIGAQLARMNLSRLLIDVVDDRHWIVGGLIY